MILCKICLIPLLNNVKIRSNIILGRMGVVWLSAFGQDSKNCVPLLYVGQYACMLLILDSDIAGWDRNMIALGLLSEWTGVLKLLRCRWFCIWAGLQRAVALHMLPPPLSYPDDDGTQYHCATLICTTALCAMLLRDARAMLG